MADLATTYKDLRVYRNSMNAAMDIYEVTKSFPVEERYSLVDQVRRCSRSVCANISEAWRKRRYKAAFIAKMSDAESEAAETQVWIELASRCKYITESAAADFQDIYDEILGQIVKMIDEAEKWTIKKK